MRGSREISRTTHLGLEIAVDDAVVTEKRQRGKDLHREASDEDGRESSELVRLDELVEVDAEQLRDDAEVSSESERVDHPNDKVLLVGILQVETSVRGERRSGSRTNPFDKVLKHLNLDERLVVESLLVADDLDRDHLAGLVVTALHDLAEGSLAEDVDDLVAVEDLVVGDEEVVAALVVESKVVERDVLARGLLVALGPDEVDFLVLADLLLLVVGEVPSVQRDGICGESPSLRDMERVTGDVPSRSKAGRG